MTNLFNILIIVYSRLYDVQHCPTHSTSITILRSFFADEIDTGKVYLVQMQEWIRNGKIQVPPVRRFDFRQIREAHNALTSGQSVGKLIISFNEKNDR